LMLAKTLSCWRSCSVTSIVTLVILIKIGDWGEVFASKTNYNKIVKIDNFVKFIFCIFYSTTRASFALIQMRKRSM
jgi:hypothetical protein